MFPSCLSSEHRCRWLIADGISQRPGARQGWFVSSAREGMGNGRSNRLYMVVTGYLGGPMKLVIEWFQNYQFCGVNDVFATPESNMKHPNTTTTIITMMFLPQTCPIAHVEKATCFAMPPNCWKMRRPDKDEKDSTITAPAVKWANMLFFEAVLSE